MLMGMKKIVFSLLIFFILFNQAQAAVVINEVMYDVPSTDTDREWLEISNNGSEAVDLTGWKLFEANSNHSLSVSQGSVSLTAGGYAVIVDNPTKFLIDWPSFSGTILDSVFSLSNSGESLVLKDNTGAVVNELSYDVSLGAGGDGNSLQRTDSGTWISTMPTPGAVNSSIAFVPPAATSTNPAATSTDPGTATSTATTTVTTSTSNNAGGSYVSSHYSSANLSPAVATAPLVANAGRKRLAVVGVPLEFRNNPPDTYDSDINWTFGDGASARGKSVRHTYFYPGTYEVVLNVQRGFDQAVSRTSVQVVQPQISFGTVNREKIVIKNNSAHELNLGDWRLVAGEKSFSLPQDTLVLAGGELLLPSAVTLLAPESPLQVRLLLPSGNVALGSESLPPATVPELAQVVEELKVALVDNPVNLKPKKSEVKNNHNQLASVSSLGDTVTLLPPSSAKLPWWRGILSWFGD